MALKRKDSYCIKHDARLAANRCKQCHKPLCGECALSCGEDGVFCSDRCHTIYRQFADRAGRLPKGRRRIASGGIARLAISLVKLALVFAVIVFVLLVTGNRYKIGLKYVEGKTPIPLEPVIPKRSSSPTP